ncbi:MAG: hypothetical protein ACRD3E_16710 [Terriglobales bacterium]
MSLGDLLSRLAPALERAGIPYMLTGSVASSAHGTARSTQDLDIVIAPTQAQLIAFIREFPIDQYYADEQQALSALANRSQFNVIDFATNWKTDFIIAKDSEYARTAMSRRLRIEIGGTPVYVASPEDVILAKLQWAKLTMSDRQLDDVRGILRAQRDKLDFAYTEGWIRELGVEAEWQKVRETR